MRRELERQFGSEQVHEEGLRVYTTLDLDLQQAANRAVLDGLAALNAVTDGRETCSMWSPPEVRWTTFVIRTGASRSRQDRTCTPW